MKVVVLGVCGTLMAGVAELLIQLGHEVIGMDKAYNPPISNILNNSDINCITGYPESLNFTPDLVIVGNAISRGNPTMEWVLNNRVPYMSAPEWIATHLSRYEKVISICGTHGKTSVTAMLTWVLKCAQLNPGYLIAGVAQGLSNFSAIGDGIFILESDEYDSAYFDKRPKCLHYKPTHVLINNLEFDHADIYSSLEEIQHQIRLLIKMVPSKGYVVVPDQVASINSVVDGCFSKLKYFNVNENHKNGGLSYKIEQQTILILKNQEKVSSLNWDLHGEHWVHNALAVLTLAEILGLDLRDACDYLSSFPGVERRCQFKLKKDGVEYWDDFAHHPTSIRMTLEALKSSNRLIAIFNPSNFTQREGVMQKSLAKALSCADQVFILKPAKECQSTWNEFEQSILVDYQWIDTLSGLSEAVISCVSDGDRVITMGSSSYDDFYKGLESS